MNLALFVFQLQSLIPSHALEDPSLYTLVSFLLVTPSPYLDDVLCLFDAICVISFII